MELFTNKIPSLAPMAGVSDRSYRILCRRFGAGLLYSEMVSAKGVCYQNTKTEELCFISDFEQPMGIQLFGSEPEYFSKAADKLMKYKPAFYDINMGCPVPKVVKQGAGSALMKTPETAEEVLRELKRAVPVPVTVKMRTGWDKDSVNAVDFAKRMEAAGADAICVHGRTREQFYSGRADLSVIAEVKKAVSVPVIANGDVKDLASCLEMYKKTGCDSVMIGRASYGNPWVFREIASYFKGETYTPPTMEERLSVCLEHIKMIIENSEKPESLSIREARKYASWYLSGIRNAARFRKLCYELTSFKDAEDLVEQALTAINEDR